MEAKRTKNNDQLRTMSKKAEVVLPFILFLFSFLFLGRNWIFYSYHFVVECKSDAMIYNADSAMYTVPIAWMYGKELSADEIWLQIPEGLPVNTIIRLYQQKPNGVLSVLEERTVRHGVKKVQFHTQNQVVNSLLIQLVNNNDGVTFVQPENITLKLLTRDRNLLQKNFKYLIKVLFCFIATALLTFSYTFVQKSNQKSNNKISALSSYDTAKNMRTQRNSSLELLRIICMILLIGHHFSVHGGLLNLDISEYPIPKLIGLIFLPVGKICFITYIAISMYFLVDGWAKFSRFLRCWMEVLFYSVTITIIDYALGGAVRIRDFISSFFVMTGNSHGFAASYLLFLLLYPFLRKLTAKITINQARYLLIVFFFAQIVSQVLYAITGYDQPVHSELTLFIFCYFLSLNLKRSNLLILNSKIFCGGVIIVIYSLLFFLTASSGGAGQLGKLIISMNKDESGLLYIIAGYALFYLFLNIRIPYSSFINTVARGTFGVLLIHDHNFFRHIFWNEVIRTENTFASAYFILCFLVLTVSIFISLSVIDLMRQKLMEDALMNNYTVKRFVRYMDAKLLMDN